MATQIKFRRGTTAQHAGFAGASGELTIDTDKQTLLVHDGSTLGGFPLLREMENDLAPVLGGNLVLNGFNLMGGPALSATANGMDVNIVAGDGGTTSGDGGNVSLKAGAVVSGAGGDVILEPKDGTSDYGAVVVQATSGPPSTFANKMYNNGGVLFWEDQKVAVEAPVVPTTATDAGVAGQVAWDAGFWYVCVANNTWKRTPLASW